MAKAKPVKGTSLHKFIAVGGKVRNYLAVNGVKAKTASSKKPARNK